MSDLTPLDGVRSEHFLNGEDLKPITRREHFYAGQESKLPEGHQEPETKEEWFIRKFRGSDVTIEELTVTDNGTYSEDDVAYSPVTVNVDKGLEIVDLDSADIVTFSDGLALPITSGKFYINAEQDLNGYDKPWAGGSGKNLIPPTIYNYAFDNDAIVEGSSYRGMWAKIDAETTYTLSRNTVIGNRFRIYGCVDEPAAGVSATQIVSADNQLSNTFTVPSGYNYIFVYLANNGVEITSNIQLEEGSTATTYEPYSNICPITGFSSMDIVVSSTESASGGQTYSTTFDDCYGGYVDCVNSKLVTTWGNIASYNGETLTGAWLSSMDEYTEGGTPTTGAQVVYELATATETTISIPTISTLEGTNNVYHNCNGQTEISVLKEA